GVGRAESVIVAPHREPRVPRGLLGLLLFRPAPPRRDGHPLRRYAVPPVPDRRAPPAPPAVDPVRPRCPPRLPLVLLRVGRGDELGARDRAGYAALSPDRP